MSTPVRGLRTALYFTSDLSAAKEWWSHFLGYGPYFDQPFYVGFSVAGYELGVVPDGSRHGESCALWGVDDVELAIADAVAHGATVIEEATDVGGGITTGSVRTPQGHVAGFIFNPHFT